MYSEPAQFISNQASELNCRAGNEVGSEKDPEMTVPQQKVKGMSEPDILHSHPVTTPSGILTWHHFPAPTAAFTIEGI